MYEAELETFLAELGNNPDEVAETLMAGEWKGYRHDACHCPVANALSDRFSGYNHVEAAEVGAWALLVTHGNTSQVIGTAQVTKAIRDFIYAFDRGQYPELELHRPQPSFFEIIGVSE